MKDIRHDLKERLESASDQYSECIDRLEQLDEELTAVQKLLNLEEKKFGPLEITNTDVARVSPTTSPSQFILSKLSDGQIWPTANLRDAALEAGLLRTSRSPGRSIQGALMGLIKQGKVENAGDAEWVATKKYLAVIAGEAPN